MFVDATALVAILAQEPDWRRLALRLEQTAKIYVSPLVVCEAVAGLCARRQIPPEQAEALVARFVEETGAQIITITAAIGREAQRALRLFGRGRHPASLDLAAAFSYGCARAYRVPLLYRGDSFSLTDIEVG